MKIFTKYLLSFFILTNIAFADITIAYSYVSDAISKEPTAKQIIDLEKIKKISNANNIKVSIKALPWKRGLLMLEKGLLDGLINASYNDKRAMYANYPMKDGILDSSKRLNDGHTYYIYRHKDSLIRWDGEKFLPTGSVGVMQNYAVLGDLKKHKNITIKEFSNNAELIRKLASNKIDAYASTTVSMNEILKKYSQLSENILREAKPIRKKDYFLVFSKITYEKKAKEMETLWRGFQEFNK